MRLIPIEKRNSYKCLMCGSQPVKYFIKCTFPIDDEHEREYAFCNLCALKFSVNVHDQDTFLKDGDNH